MSQSKPKSVFCQGIFFLSPASSTRITADILVSIESKQNGTKRKKHWDKMLLTNFNNILDPLLRGISPRRIKRRYRIWEVLFSMLIPPSVQFLLGQNNFHTQQNKLITHQLIFEVITYKTELYLHLIVLVITFYVTSKFFNKVLQSHWTWLWLWRYTSRLLSLV